jgi:periplasmic protein TonB
MIWIIITACLIAAVTFYDFSWSNATNNIRNEVVFKERHKNYGAYALRVEYGKQVMAAFTTILFLCGGLLYGSKLFTSYTEKKINLKPATEVIITEVEEEEEVIEIPEKETTVIPPLEDLKTWLDPMAKNEAKDSTSQDDLDKALASNITAKKDTVNGEHKTIFEEAPDDKKCKDCEEGPVTISQLEELPSFPGWGDYLTKNLKYPADAREMGVQGKVFVEFTIMKDGSVRDVKIKHSLYGSLDQEAARVIREMPANWSPGKINGHAVNVRLSQPIKFKLSNDK